MDKEYSKLNAVVDSMNRAELSIQDKVWAFSEMVKNNIQSEDLPKDINDGLQAFAYSYMMAEIMDELEIHNEAKQMYAQVNMIKGHILAEASQ